MQLADAAHRHAGCGGTGVCGDALRRR